jgi:hypothetical protein
MLKRSSTLLALAALFLAGPLLAQRGGMGLPMMPPVMNGLWNPVVGSGAIHEQTEKDGTKRLITLSVVGKEDSEGQTGYWMEFVSGEEARQNVTQMLMVKSGDNITVAKAIAQQSGQPPMLISSAMLAMMTGRGGFTPPTPKADIRNGAEAVGTESVTTPAGTFECEHLRTKDGANAWISPKAGPWSLVKIVSPNSSMVVVKIISDAKSHDVGTPQPIESMMGGRGRGQE